MPVGSPIEAHGFANTVRSRVVNLYRLLKDHFFALADQAVVSAASFLTTIIISRYSNAGELGAYAIGISILGSAYTIQGQLISLPYSIQRHRPIGTPTEFAGSSLVLAGLLASLVTMLLTVVALSLFAGHANPELVAVTWALAAVMPFALFRDFFRRFSFAHLRMTHALLLDSAVAASQLLMLGWLGWTGRMSAVTASIALGASCGIVALGCLSLSRGQFRIRRDQLRAAMGRSWFLGRWLVGNQILVQVQRYSMYWLLVMIAGATTTGIYAACMSIVAFANPIFYGLNNLLTQKSVLAWKEGGATALRKRAVRDLILLAAALAPFCLLALWGGEEAMQFFYPSPVYAGYGHLIAILAAAILAFALGSPAANALASMERVNTVFAVNAVGTAVTALLVWRFLLAWGLMGAAWGWLLSNTTVAIGLWFGFLRSVKRVPDEKPARKVLDELVGTSNSKHWSLTYLGEGDHSNVYAARADDGQPSWRSNRTLVLKVFKPEANLPIESVKVQFDSLSRLHASLDGHVINGWTISIPIPLYIGRAPLALVMTDVPGKDLRSQIEVDESLTPAILESMGRTVISVMQRSWSRGEMHGDLGLQNILYDIDARRLAFIDPGTEECCLVCMHTERRWKPEILELGHILRDLGTDIKDLTGNRTARTRRSVFTESALRAFIGTIEPPERRLQVIEEIFECGQAHLSKVIETSGVLRAVLGRLVRRFFVQRMDAVLAELRTDVATGALFAQAASAASNDGAYSSATKAPNLEHALQEQRRSIDYAS